MPALPGPGGGNLARTATPPPRAATPPPVPPPRVLCPLTGRRSTAYVGAIPRGANGRGPRTPLTLVAGAGPTWALVAAMVVVVVVVVVLLLLLLLLLL